MKRTVHFLPLALVMLAGSSVYAEPLPNFDAAMNVAAASSPPRSSSATLGTVASVDPQRGVPSFVWAAPTPASAASLASRVMTAAPERVARDFVAQNMDLYGLSPAAVGTMFVRHIHDTGRGGIIVVFGQRVDGTEVYATEMKVLIDRQGDVIAVGGNLHADAISSAARGAALAFKVKDDKAVASAFADLTGIKLAKGSLINTKREQDGYRYYDLAGAPKAAREGLVFTNPARVKKVFYSMPARIVPAYYLEIDLGRATSTSSDLWGYVISAETGELLMRRHLTLDVAFNYKVWAEQAAPNTPLDGPVGDWTPHPTGLPDKTLPPFVAPSMISIEGFNTNPSNAADPWLAAAATVSTGNNVDAYADIAAPDGFTNGDVRANTTSANTFDYTYNVALAPGSSANQRKAAVTELFFMNNWLHDYMYDSGFNESAGNAQTNNFGRGGAQNDPIHAEGQDSSGVDNANMSTPADGQSPRMQMYLFNGVTVGHLDVSPLNLSLENQPAGFGPQPFSVSAQLVLASDGVGPDVNDICENVSNNIAGKIALINRGTCTFEDKVLRAQQAGAVGVIIANNAAPGLPGMGDDPATNGVTIGSLGISLADGDALKAAMMSQTLTVSMSTDPPTVMRDGTIDNMIIAHEWGHYIHFRLVTCLTDQCGAESEGWGDFNAMLMAVRAGDNVDSGTFSSGTYAEISFGDVGYFGVRRFPYTRDLNKNGLTFKHVTDGVALPPGPQNANGINNWEVHNAGEVWASMLFQAYTELLIGGGHPFAEAKRRMADYFVGGMLLAPANPTFTQQRDAILATARAADFNDAVLLAKGFADRGAGTCAVSPPANSTTGAGVVEDFNSSGVMQITGTTIDEVTSCDTDGVVDTEELGKVNVSVFNSGLGYLPNTTVTVASTSPGVTFPNGNAVTIANINPGTTAVGSVNVALAAGTAAITDADFTVTVTNNTACTKTVNASFSARMNYDTVLSSSATENVDSIQAPWTRWGAPGYQALAPTLWSQVKEAAVSNYRFNGKDHAALSDTALESPDLVVGAGNLTITFAHAYDFDYTGGPARYWDGGVVEFTSDGGQSWADVSTLGAAPGYNNTIYNATTNPLANRQGYVRRNAAWPNTNNVTLNMGNTLAGKTIRIRFRIGTDPSEHATLRQGWFIDTIAVAGITNLPFHTITTDPLGCAVGCNGVPGACNDGNACTDDVCNAATGLCSNPAKANGAACSDGDACTTVDSCAGGTCTGASPVVCAALDQCHVAGVCDAATGACSNPTKADGASCNDGDACTMVDSCAAGACLGAGALACNDNNGCTDDACNPASGCVFTNNNAACNDGDSCTQADACQGGACVGASPVVCAPPDACHAAGVCDAATGVCGYASIGSDGDGDTVGDACDNCPLLSNAGQADMDTDGAGDVCDNCPAITNAGQADLDGDSAGDVCDADIDGDGISNAVEMGIGTSPVSKDSDGDSIDDCTEACDQNDGSCLVNGVCTFGAAADTDNDSTIDALDDDSDDDGATDAAEAGDADLNTPPVDTDKDGLPDYRDVEGGGAGGAGGAGTGGMGTGGVGGAGGMGAGTGGMGAGTGGKGGGTGGVGGGTGGRGAGGAGGGGLIIGGSDEDGGCGCEAVGASSSPAGSRLAALLAAAMLFLRKRRLGHGTSRAS